MSDHLHFARVTHQGIGYVAPRYRGDALAERVLGWKLTNVGLLTLTFCSLAGIALLAQARRRKPRRLLFLPS